MNIKLRKFEDAINQALNDADDDLEIAEIIGVMQIKLHVQCQRLMALREDSGEDGPDPADAWKRLKR